MATPIFVSAGCSETQDFSLWDGGINGTMSYDGTFSAMKFGPGYGETFRTGILANAGRAISFQFRTDTSPAALATFCTLLTNTFNTFCSLKLTTSRTITVTPQNATATTGSIVLAINTWYTITLAYSYTDSTHFRFQVYVDGVADANATAGTFTFIGANADGLDLSSDTAAGASNINYARHVYVDDRTDCTCPGFVLATAKRPFANGTANEFTTQIGVGNSGYGSGHADEVNERPLSETNGWSLSTTTRKTEEYVIEGRAVGDANIAAAGVVGVMGWIRAKVDSVANSPVHRIQVDGTLTAKTMATSYGSFFQISATPTVYPAGTGTDIGMDGQYTTTPHVTSLAECGVIVAYLVPPAGRALLVGQAVKRASYW